FNSLHFEVTTTSEAGMSGLLSDAVTRVLIIVNHVVLSSIVGILGTIANVINICVFVKQGLTNSMNASLFAMAVSELCSLVTLLWLNVCINPYISVVETSFVFTEILYLTAGWPHGCSARITSWITVYITAERCLSITLPLRIKRLVTPRRSAAILTLIYAVNILTLVPEYSTVYYDWKFYPARNKTMVGLAFRGNRPVTDGLTFAFHAGMSLCAFVCVIVFTSVLVNQLRRTSKWRRKSAPDQQQLGSLSTRDKKAVSLIILVALSLIVCYTPTVSLSVMSICLPGFSVVGKEANLFNAAWSFGFLFHAINSNVNIILYYKMSSKYREKFNQLFK
ncbi:unnamed protein product, partial [Lymnaea stagnalis]